MDSAVDSSWQVQTGSAGSQFIKQLIKIRQTFLSQLLTSAHSAITENLFSQDLYRVENFRNLDCKSVMESYFYLKDNFKDYM